MNIPSDLRGFLSDPSKLKLSLPPGGEIQTVAFYPLAELQLKNFSVDSSELFSLELLQENPEEEREYEGYPLIKTCNDYDPDGVLVWFPSLEAFGSADVGHGRIMIYPGLTWTEIMEEPMWYINGQWYPENVEHVEVNPWQN